MKGSARCVEMITNDRAWKEMEEMSGHERKRKGTGKKQLEM